MNQEINTEIKNSLHQLKKDPNLMSLSQLFFGIYFHQTPEEYDFKTLNSAAILLDSYASIIHDLEFGGKWFKLVLHDSKHLSENQTKEEPKEEIEKEITGKYAELIKNAKNRQERKRL